MVVKTFCLWIGNSEVFVWQSIYLPQITICHEYWQQTSPINRITICYNNKHIKSRFHEYYCFVIIVRQNKVTLASWISMCTIDCRKLRKHIVEFILPLIILSRVPLIYLSATSIFYSTISKIYVINLICFHLNQHRAIWKYFVRYIRRNDMYSNSFQEIQHATTW